MGTATAVRTGVLGFVCALLTVTAHTGAGGRMPGPLALIGIVAACSGLGLLVSRRRWAVGTLVVLFGGCQLSAHVAMETLSPVAPPSPAHDMTSSMAPIEHTGAHSLSMALVHVVVAIVSAVLLCRAERVVGLLLAIAEWFSNALTWLTPWRTSFVAPPRRRPRVVAVLRDAARPVLGLAYGVSRRGPPVAPAPDPIR